MTQRDRFPLYAGDSSNIYRGSIIHPEGHKIQVAIKLLRIIVNDAIQLEDILKRLKREALAWSEITHPNLHPFIGMYDIGAPFPVLISPFCKFGHIGNYLTEYPLTNRSLLVHGVASGLKHLHDKDIVHGDLKLQNILIDKRGVACICDFGVSKIINPDGFTTWSVETLTYIAPELLISSDPRNASVTRPQITKSSDVYSFALLVLEILTSESPRRPASLDRLLTNVKFLGGFRPQRAHYDVAKLTHQMWSVLDQCWNPEPQLRPTMAKILLSPGFGALRR
ncbi:kinase-like domain-containing protein [Mycena sanguinolenta]|nr:kinase-like domain-containing protein [Mycena sanguinolenta]